jgi:hypothetical protein
MKINQAITAIKKLSDEWKQKPVVDCKMSVFNGNLIIINKDLGAMMFIDEEWKVFSAKDWDGRQKS